MVKRNEDYMSKLKLLLIFILILGFGSVFENFYPRLVQIIELFFILLLLSGKRVQLKGNSAAYLVVIYFCVFVSAIATGTSILDYTSLILRPIFAILILSSFNFNYEEIKFCFRKVLRFIAWLAVINWILVLFAPGLFGVAVSHTGFTVNTIGLVFNYIETGYTERLGLGFYRNQGIFWEPGVLEIMMNYLIYLELFEYKKNIKSIIVPVLVLLSTASTSGYILFAILLGIRYLKQLKNSTGFKKKLTTILAAIFIVGIFTPFVYTEVTYKMTTGVGSANLRQYDMLMGLAIAKEHPLFGIGPNTDRFIQEAKHVSIFVGEDDNVNYGARASSNLFTTLFASYGIPLALLLIYSLYRQNIFRNRRVFFIIIFIGLMSEPVMFTDLYFVWIMSGAFTPKERSPELISLSSC